MLPVYKYCRAKVYAEIKAQDACIEFYEDHQSLFDRTMYDDVDDLEDYVYRQAYNKAYTEYMDTTPEIGLPDWCKHW